jgi:hypothetical protein
MRRYALAPGGDDRRLEERGPACERGAVLAGPLLVLRSQTYVFEPQFARIFSKKDAHNIFLMTVLILHQFPLGD